MSWLAACARMRVKAEHSAYACGQTPPPKEVFDVKVWADQDCGGRC